MRREVAQMEGYYQSEEYIQEVLDNFHDIMQQVLPKELQERAEQENWSLEKLNYVIEHRKEQGLNTIKGFHCSDNDMQVGHDLEGEVFYSTDLNSLYGKKAKWLYIIDGASNDQVVNEDLGWHSTRRAREILAKIRLNDNVVEKLGASFAKVEYH